MVKLKSARSLFFNYLPTKPLETGNNSYDFGVQLAQLHSWGEQKEFGCDQDNYIGSTLQPNPCVNKNGAVFSQSSAYRFSAATSERKRHRIW
ncbi:fructosamine kinase family protein [Vibrio lentus]|nr:fructosamine kinase family protein [Vibrio lentus]